MAKDGYKKLSFKDFLNVDLKPGEDDLIKTQAKKRKERDMEEGYSEDAYENKTVRVNWKNHPDVKGKKSRAGENDGGYDAGQVAHSNLVKHLRSHPDTKDHIAKNKYGHGGDGRGAAWITARSKKSAQIIHAHIKKNFHKSLGATTVSVNEGTIKEAHKPGNRVIITKGPHKGKTGNVGEIHRSAGGAKTYVIDVHDNPQEPNVRLQPGHFKAHKGMKEGYRVHGVTQDGENFKSGTHPNKKAAGHTHYKMTKAVDKRGNRIYKKVELHKESVSEATANPSGAKVGDKFIYNDMDHVVTHVNPDSVKAKSVKGGISRSFHHKHYQGFSKIKEGYKVPSTVNTTGMSPEAAAKKKAKDAHMRGDVKWGGAGSNSVKESKEMYVHIDKRNDKKSMDSAHKFMQAWGSNGGKVHSTSDKSVIYKAKKAYKSTIASNLRDRKVSHDFTESTAPKYKRDAHGNEIWDKDTSAKIQKHTLKNMRKQTKDAVVVRKQAYTMPKESTVLEDFITEKAYKVNLSEPDYQKIRKASMRGNFNHKFSRKTNGDTTFSTSTPKKLATDLEKLIDSGENSWSEYLGIKEDLNEVLSYSARRAKARSLRKNKAKIKMGARKARRRMADRGRLKNRAQKQARNSMFLKLSKGVPRSDMPPARRAQIEKRLSKMGNRIQRIAKRTLPAVRKMEIERKRSQNKS